MIRRALGGQMSLHVRPSGVIATIVAITRHPDHVVVVNLLMITVMVLFIVYNVTKALGLTEAVENGLVRIFHLCIFPLAWIYRHTSLSEVIAVVRFPTDQAAQEPGAADIFKNT